MANNNMNERRISKTLSPISRDAQHVRLDPTPSISSATEESIPVPNAKSLTLASPGESIPVPNAESLILASPGESIPVPNAESLALALPEKSIPVSNAESPAPALPEAGQHYHKRKRARSQAEEGSVLSLSPGDASDDEAKVTGPVKKSRKRQQKATTAGSSKYTPRITAKQIVSNDIAGFKNNCLRPHVSGGLGNSNEPVLFAYAGFSDRMVARRWLLSPPFLRAMRLFHDTGSPAQFAYAMELYNRENETWTRESRDLDWAKERWPVRMRPDTAMAETTDKPNSRYILAFLMWWLPLANARYCALSPSEQQAEYEALALEYPYWLPTWVTIAHIPIVSPVWQHPADQVAHAERCCRLWGLLRLLQGNVAGLTSGDRKLDWETKWRRFWTAGDVLESTAIADTCKPIWMQENNNLSSTLPVSRPVPVLKAVSSPREINFKVPSPRNHAMQLGIRPKRDNEEWEEFQVDRETKIVHIPDRCILDPRDFNFEGMWRDLLRIQMKVNDSETYIGSLAIATSDDEDDGLTSFYSRRSRFGAAMTWPQFQEHVEATVDRPIEIFVSMEYSDDFYPDMEYNGDLSRYG